MGLNIPKVVQSLFVNDGDATRVRDNLTVAVQPILDFINQYFLNNADGSLTVLRNMILGGSINGAVRINGTVYVVTPTANGFVIQPGAPGPALYVTNVGGSVASFIIYDTGAVRSLSTIQGASVISDQGFKQTVKMGQYYHTSYPGGQRNTVEPLYNIANGAMTTKVARHIAPRSGSVTAIQVDNETPVNTTCDVGVVVNGTTLIYPRLMTANQGKGTVTFAKGVLPFAAGDTLSCLCGFGAASITVAIAVSFEIETGA